MDAQARIRYLERTLAERDAQLARAIKLHEAACKDVDTLAAEYERLAAELFRFGRCRLPTRNEMEVSHAENRQCVLHSLDDSARP